MNTEQRRALADMIPTTEVVKDAVTFPRERLGEPLDISPERFDAWLARVKRGAAREALDGLADAYADDPDVNEPEYEREAFVAQAARYYRDAHYPEETP